MDITPRIAANAQIIQSYTDGRFRISNQLFSHAVIVTPTAVYAWDNADLTPESIMAALQAIQPLEVVLLGCGGQLNVIPPWVRTARQEMGVTVDIMDTGAACRTYNVLLTEGRQVAAFLLPTG